MNSKEFEEIVKKQFSKASLDINQGWEFLHHKNTFTNEDTAHDASSEKLDIVIRWVKTDAHSGKENFIIYKYSPGNSDYGTFLDSKGRRLNYCKSSKTLKGALKYLDFVCRIKICLDREELFKQLKEDESWIDIVSTVGNLSSK